MQHLFKPRHIMFLLMSFVAMSYLALAVGSGIITWRVLQSSTASNSEKLLTCAYAAALPFANSAPQFLPRPAWMPQWSPGMFNSNVWLDIYDIQNVGTFIITRNSAMLPRADGLKAIIWIVLLGSMAAITPVSFAAIPFSRAQARVRTSHLMRIALYSLVPIGMMIVAVHAARSPIFPWVFYSVVGMSLTCSLIWYPLFLAVWWSAACRNYLKLPHSWGVGICFACIGSLTTFLIAVVLTMLFHG